MNYKKAGVIISITLLILISSYLYFKTGFFDRNGIDKIDLEKWTYSKNLIIDAEEYQLDGNKETCWLMIHGFASTPKDFNELSIRVNQEFNEQVNVPRLEGHGEVPSKLYGLNFDDWYNQIEKEYLNLKKECDKINLVGFSLGSTLALKIAENYEINNLYVISPFIKLRYKFWNIFKKETIIKMSAKIIVYKKKIYVAQVNSLKGKIEHIAYFSTPFMPLKESFDEIDKVSANLNKINENILIQHSINDDTIDFKSSKIIFKNVNSINKEIISYTKSNHVLTRDYDKEEVINNIINFEKKTKKENNEN